MFTRKSFLHPEVAKKVAKDMAKKSAESGLMGQNLYR